MADLDEKDDAPKLVAAVLVDYCKICGLPTEYCEYGPNPAQCAAAGIASVNISSEEKSSEMPVPVISGKGNKKAVVAAVLGTVTISKQNRTKKKAVTTVAGLETFGVKLKDAAKLFSKRFACSASVVEGVVPNTEELAVQGDVVFEIADFIVEKFPEVHKGRIFLMEKDKKSRIYPDAAEDDEANEVFIVSDAQEVIDSL